MQFFRLRSRAHEAVGAPAPPLLRARPTRAYPCGRALLAWLPAALFLLSAAGLFWEPPPAAAPAALPPSGPPARAFVPPVRALLEEEAQPCGAAARALTCEAWCAASPLAPSAAALAPARSCAARPLPLLHALWASLLGGTAAAAPPPASAQAAGAARDRGPRPIVLYTGYNGLADSLAGAVSAFYIALLAGAEFHMRFSDSAQDPSFLWAFDPGCMDALSARWELAEGGSEVRIAPSAAGAPGPALPAQHYSFDAFHVPPDFLATVQAGNVSALWQGRAVLSLHTHLGLVHHLMDNPLYRARLRGMGLTLHNAFAEAYHFLLRPRSLGLARYARELAAMQDASALRIGIHVRSGVHHDGAFQAPAVGGEAAAPAAPPQRVPFAPFFACAEEVEGQLAPMLRRQRAVWYLISDSLRLREEAARAWPGKVLTRTTDLTLAHTRSSLLPSAAQNSTCTSFLDAAMEHWLFGLADAHVISQWSGFGRTGSLVHVGAPPRKPVFQVYPLNPDVVSCALARQATMGELVAHLPGI